MVQATNPVISVCIANYNGNQVIADCIQSVLDQINSPAFEIIIHDDCSQDDSLDILNDFAGNIELITSNKNVGFCIANNRMAMRARGAFLLFLNNDARLEENALSELYNYAHSQKDCLLTLPQYDAVTKQLLDCGMAMDIFANPIPLEYVHTGPVATAMGACLWVPKSVWDQVGGFPEWFGSIGEDMFLCCAARRLGYETVALSNSKYFHHVGLSFGGGKVLGNELASTYKRRALSEQNKTKVIMSTYPFIPMVFVMPFHLALLMVEGIIMSIRFRDTRPLKEIYLPAILVPIRYFQLVRQVRGILAKRSVKKISFFSSIRLLPYKLRMLFMYGFPNLK